jgi:Rap1a immunity proteins
MTRAGMAILASLVVFLSVTASTGAFQTGREWVNVCTPSETAEQRILNLACVSYVDGYLDAYRVSMGIMEQQAPTARQPICLPERGVDIEQIKTLVDDWLLRHPSDLSLNIRTVVLQVLIKAYPCPWTPKRK